MFLRLNVSPASTGTVSITTIEQTSLIAPTVVYADATSISGMAAQDGADPGEVYDPSFHEITFIWTLTRPAGASSVWSPTLAMPTAWNNRNLAYGKRVAFVLDEPGNYTLDLWCVDVNGVTATASKSFTVQDPDAVFTGSRTILYDPAGVGDPATYPGANVQTTWAGVKAARTALGSTTARMLVKRGEQITGEQIANFGSGVNNIRIGPWGSGATPILGPRGVDADYMIKEDGSGGNDELIIYGVNFQGGWDSTTETGIPELPFQLFRNSTRGNIPYFQLIHQCGFDGLVSCWITSGLTNFEARSCYSECTITNWRDYGLFMADGGDPSGDNRLAILGCSVRQHVDALSGGAKNSLFNTHGCFRTTGMQNTYVAGCSMFSRSGWSGLGTRTADNGALRLNTQGNEGHNYVIDRVAVEGMIRVENAENGNNDPAGNYLFDRVVQIAGGRCYNPLFSVQYGGATIRNYHGTMFNVPADHGAIMGEFISAETDGLDAVNVASPVRIYNSTFLDLRNDANASGAPDAVSFNNFSAGVENNNILHAPNRSSPVVGDAPLDMATSVGLTPVHKGPRYNFLHEEGVFFSPIAPGGTFSIPYTYITETEYNTIGQSGGGNPVRTATVTNGSTTVTGVNTSWLTYASVGGLFIHNGTEERYYIAAVVSDTEITLDRPYAGTSETTTSFKVDLYKDAPATNQAYWTAIEATDTLHVLDLDGTGTGRGGFHRQLGEISVTFGATEVVIENTSAETWPAGVPWVLKLDRKSLLGPFESAHSSVGLTAPTGKPQAGSAAQASGDTGLKPYDDIQLTVRPSSGNSRGAFLSS